jgi:hypothetical protein
MMGDSKNTGVYSRLEIVNGVSGDNPTTFRHTKSLLDTFRKYINNRYFQMIKIAGMVLEDSNRHPRIEEKIAGRR